MRLVGNNNNNDDDDWADDERMSVSKEYVSIEDNARIHAS